MKAVIRRMKEKRKKPQRNNWNKNKNKKKGNEKSKKVINLIGNVTIVVKNIIWLKTIFKKKR